MTNLCNELEQEIAEAEKKALNSLAVYKFIMFGYWAAVWVHLNRLHGSKQPNPFFELVKTARRLYEHRYGAVGVQAKQPLADLMAEQSLEQAEAAGELQGSE